MRKPSRIIRSARIAAIVAEQVERRLLMSTYTVNTLSDAANPGTGLLTLRQAVADANAHTGADTINFSGSVFSAGTQHTITLTQGPITFSDTSGATTVTGPGSAVAEINANNQSRLFDIDDNTIVSISGLTLTGGKQTSADSNTDTYGGAIYNAGILTITDSIVSGNTVAASASYYVEDIVSTAGTAMGGAIYSTGPLTITGSVLSDNSVTNTAVASLQITKSGAAYGGAIYSTGLVFLTNDSITDNSLTGSSSDDVSGNYSGQVAGGGIYVTATVTVSETTVTGNSATAGSPAVYGQIDGSNAYGGGIFASAGLTITNSAIASNTITASRSSYDAGFSGIAQGGGVYCGGAVTAIGTNITDNTAIAGDADYASGTSAGGGLYAASNATLVGDQIDGNSVEGGPGDYPGDLIHLASLLTTAGGGVFSAGSLNIQNSSISDNQVTPQIPEDTSEGRAGGFEVGGGIASTAAATITDSTISGNHAIGGKGPDAYPEAHYPSDPGGDGAGGGIYSSSTLTLINSTVANNSAIGGAGGDADFWEPASNGGDGIGGGICSTDTLIVADSTITGNASTAGAGGQSSYTTQYPAGTPGSASAGGVAISAGTAVFTNSIISANTAAGAFDDIDGAAGTGSAYNIIGVGGGLTNHVDGNKVGFNDPMLSPLGNYGGPTQTMVPLPGSPPVDSGNASLIPAGITTDQRGYDRISRGTVDVGATELGNSSLFGVVFDDANGNGKLNLGETDLAGITVYIDANNNGKLDPGELSTTTNVSGEYFFPYLNPGLFKIREIVPAGWKQTTPANDYGWTLYLGNNQSTAGLNFGEQSLAPTGSISGTVFNDLNGNGAMNSGETGIAGITVYDDANNNGKLDPGELTTTTNSSGDYSFIGLPAGNYKIREVIPAGWKQTTPASNFGWTLTLAANQSLTAKNFGEQALTPIGSSITGTVFDDANGDEKQDNGEAGLVGWTVYIDSNNDGVLDGAELSTLTNTEGGYTFSNLPAGSYIIRVVRPSGWSQTTPTSNYGQHITIAKGQNATNVLFGEKQIA